jgi:hypothetical protein
MTCDSGNPGSGMTLFLISVYITGEHMTIRQAQRCGRVKPVLVYGTLFLISEYKH